MNIPAASLSRYLLDHERDNPELGADFCHLIVQLAFAAQVMAREITLAPLAVESGSAGERDASDDLQKALDILTNNTMIEAFDGPGLVAEIIAEEKKSAQM